jgi:acetyl esterase/lipase
VFLPYVGGVMRYRKACEEVVDRSYLGFAFDGPGGARCHDGVVRRMQPDAAILLELIEEIGLPPLETLSVRDARALNAGMAAQRPPGPAVGEVVDGELPGAAGPLAYRLYRPASPGPHPIVVYFHGGGWVLGGSDSDDPFCRDLCVRSGALVVSVDYRHAPESRFPAAVDDGFAALRWIAAHAEALGGERDRLAVCGWSAGGNIAAVVCQLARDAGGPPIAGQVLVTPVTDGDFSRPSYMANGQGCGLTASMMRWFWDLYADPVDRQHPKASPLRAADLSNLPPALVVTCEFDPLRDEGLDYARRLIEAGVPTELHHYPGTFHGSIIAVNAAVTQRMLADRIAALTRGLRVTADASPKGGADASRKEGADAGPKGGQ